MKSHRRGGAPWALGSLDIIAPIWLSDAGEVHHPAAEGRVPHSCRHCDHQVAAESVRGGSSPGHLRHVVTEVSGPYPTSFLPMGSYEGKDLEA